MNVTPNNHFSDKFLRRIFILFFILLLIAAIGITMRIIENRRLRNLTNEQAITTVETIKAEKGPAKEEIVLPGNVQAWHETTIYARTNGYVVQWYTDIGARVKAGDLLAVITTPEVDKQLLQTEAQLKTAQANYQLAVTTATRWKSLLKTDSVSKQETDEKVSDEKAQAAIVNSTRANRDRLLELVSFEKVVAPFDGIIMSRTTDIGRLINAGSNGAVPLFRIVQSDKLRIYIRVPQNYSSRIVPEMIAELHFSQHPDKVYPAKLLDTAKAIDANTRTLLIELEADNPNNELFPGSYTEAHLILGTEANAVRIPVNALLFQAAGLQVATLTDDDKAVLKSVTIGRDFGDYVEIVAGLTPGETIIINPPDSISPGQELHVATASSNKTKKDA